MNIEEKIIKDNEKLIYKIANMFYGIDKEDLYQAGILGLHKAYLNYNINSQAKFSTFAYQYIYGEMYSLANKKLFKINRDTLKLYKLIEKTRYKFAQEYGYIPNNMEIAKLLNMNIETIDYACASSINLLSLDNENDDTRNLYETIPIHESISIDEKIELYNALDKLPLEERNVIISHYFKDLNQDSIAKEINTSQVRVSRLEKKGISRMRKLMEV
jgi:RNA polymerase sporulation-specific sigma factor